MTIPVMLFVDGPAEGFMLSTAKQTYTVGLYPTEDGKWMTAIYYVFGSDPAYGGAWDDPHQHPRQGVYKWHGNKQLPGVLGLATVVLCLAQ